MTADTHQCGAPIRGGYQCSRPTAGILDRCWQHGGRHVPRVVARFLAGATVEELAAQNEPGGVGAVERALREWAGRCS